MRGRAALVGESLFGCSDRFVGGMRPPTPRSKGDQSPYNPLKPASRVCSSLRGARLAGRSGGEGGERWTRCARPVFDPPPARLQGRASRATSSFATGPPSEEEGYVAVWGGC